MAPDDEFIISLTARVRGEVLADDVSRAIYATDASHYQIVPRCVVLPRDAEDCTTALKIAFECRIPTTPRGGGTSLSGQTTWSGMVLDCSKYMNRILELNLEERWVRVQPGVVCDELNQALAVHGLHFAPDPATTNRANIGGMIGNNSSGTRSIVYGKTSDHVLECTIAVADGTVVTLGPTPVDGNRQGLASQDRLQSLVDDLRRIVDGNRDEIYARFPKVMRRVSGYSLDAFLPESMGGMPEPWNLARLFVGSEGTLGVLLEARLRLTPRPKATALCIVHFADRMESLRAVVPILEHQPTAVELLDYHVIDEARRNRATAAMADFLEGAPKAVQIVEVFGENPEEAATRVRRLASDLEARKIGYSWPVRMDAAGIQRVWEVRKLGLGLVSNIKSKRRGIEFIEDACVPVEVLPEYIERLLAICESHGVHVIIYAHASVGVLHVRPALDMHDPEDVQLMKRIADEVFELVCEYKGSWSSEHGDGILRGEFIPRFYGPRIYEAFRQVKQLFDPLGLMNPGKIIDAEPMLSHLRYGPHYVPASAPSRFQYREQDGFVLAVEQCNGVGACRKTGSGTMCPSYMATRDEEHCTRGRANALRMAMSGQLGRDALTQDRLMDVLDLCLSCKACKSECPNSVDMSRMKADVLQWRYDKYGTPFGARVMAALPSLFRWASGPSAGLLNWMQRRTLVRRWMQTLTGIDARRPLPPVAKRSLSKSWSSQRHVSGRTTDRGTVLLFCDTFANYLEPHIGMKALFLLEACGYRVELADVGCCQRIAISKGMLDKAIRDGERTMRRLAEQAERTGAEAVVVLEPSCASALADDLPDLLVAGRYDGLVPRIKMVDVFLEEQVSSGALEVHWTSPFKRLLIHGHCHQKAMFGTQAMKKLLAKVPDLEFREIDSGCCGMAGSFGYEHYDLSRKIGDDRLFPAVRDRAPDTEVVACGTSCRHQLADFLGVKALHWVEVVNACRSDSSHPGPRCR